MVFWLEHLACTQALSGTTLSNTLSFVGPDAISPSQAHCYGQEQKLPFFGGETVKQNE